MKSRAHELEDGSEAAGSKPQASEDARARCSGSLYQAARGRGDGLSSPNTAVSLVLATPAEAFISTCSLHAHSKSWPGPVTSPARLNTLIERSDYVANSSTRAVTRQHCPYH